MYETVVTDVTAAKNFFARAGARGRAVGLMGVQKTDSCHPLGGVRCAVVTHRATDPGRPLRGHGGFNLYTM
eukprot:3076767-Prymnesium_polylepis.1